MYFSFTRGIAEVFYIKATWILLIFYINIFLFRNSVHIEMSLKFTLHVNSKYIQKVIYFCYSWNQLILFVWFQNLTWSCSCRLMKRVLSYIYKRDRLTEHKTTENIFQRKVFRFRLKKLSREQLKRKNNKVGKIKTSKTLLDTQTLVR